MEAYDPLFLWKNQVIHLDLHVSSMAHQVFVIQPFLRFGVASKKDTNQQLMLEESIALVNTLGWKVVDHTCVGLNSFIKPFLFGSGKLADIESIISTNEKITAVFISMYQLTTTQRLELEKRFMVPVIDRYCLVLQIFYQHAQTQESRLQVALAEIPYLKNRLMVEHTEEKGRKHSGNSVGEQYFQEDKHPVRLKRQRAEKTLFLTV